MDRRLAAILIAATTLLATFPVVSTISAGNGNVGAVYIIDNAVAGNNVLAYGRTDAGTLAPIGTYSTNGLGTGAALASQGAVTLTQDGRWLLVVDAGSNEISVFAVQNGGGLTLVSKASSQGSDPISVTVNHDWVYVLDAGGAGNIAGFSLSNSGTLTYIAGSTQPLSGAATPSAEQIGFNPQGNLLVVTEKGANTIDTYAVDSDGVASAPTSLASNGMGPYGFAFTNDGLLVVSEAATNTVSSYAVSRDGVLRTVSGALPTFGNAPCWVAVSNDGQFAYTTNAHGGTISTFSISERGTLVLVSSIAARTLVPALDMAFTQNGRFMYVHDGATITGYQTYPDGGLSQVGSVSGLPASASGLAAM